jgi:hypothetical protein
MVVHEFGRQGEVLMPGIYAVLTGDVVRSSRLAPAELAALRQTILAAADQIGAWKASPIIGAPEFYRGDAWQLLLSEPRMFLRVALFIRATVRQTRGWDTRIAIGLGPVDQIEPGQISLSVGESFTLSGRQLDEMGSALGFGFDAPPELKAKAGWVAPVVSLCGELIGRLKPGQATTVCAALTPSGATQTEIAAQLGISQQAVSNALSSAGWGAIADTLSFVEGFAWDAQ